MNIKNFIFIFLFLCTHAKLHSSISVATPNAAEQKKAALAAEQAAQDADKAAQKTKKEAALIIFSQDLPTQSINENNIDFAYGSQGLKIDVNELDNIKKCYCYFEFLVKINKVKNDASLNQYKSDFQNFLQPPSDNKPLMPTQALVKSKGWKAITITPQDIANSAAWQLYIKTIICDILDNDSDFLLNISATNHQIYPYIPNFEQAYADNDFTKLRLYKESIQLQALMQFEQRAKYLEQCSEWKNLSPTKLLEAVEKFKKTDFYHYTHINMQPPAVQPNGTTQPILVPSEIREQIIAFYMILHVLDILQDLLQNNKNAEILKQTPLTPNFSLYIPSDFVYFNDNFALAELIKTNKLNPKTSVLAMQTLDANASSKMLPQATNNVTVQAIIPPPPPPTAQTPAVQDPQTIAASIFAQLPTTSTCENIIDQVYGASSLNIPADQLANLKKTYCYLEFLVKVDKVRNNPQFAQYQQTAFKDFTQAGGTKSHMPTEMLVTSDAWKAVSITQDELVISPTWQNFIKCMICDIVDNEDNFIIDSSEISHQMFSYLPNIESAYTTQDFTQMRLYTESIQLTAVIQAEQKKRYLQQCIDWKNIEPTKLVDIIATFKKTEFYTNSHSADTSNNTKLAISDTVAEEIIAYFLLLTTQNALYELITNNNIVPFLSQASSATIKANIFNYTISDCVCLTDLLSLKTLIDQNKTAPHTSTIVMTPTSTTNNVVVQSMQDEFDDIQDEDEEIEGEVIIQKIKNPFKKITKSITKGFNETIAKPLASSVAKTNKDAAKAFNTINKGINDGFREMVTGVFAFSDALATGLIEMSSGTVFAACSFAALFPGSKVDPDKEAARCKAKMNKQKAAIAIALTVVSVVVIYASIIIATWGGGGSAMAAFQNTLLTGSIGAIAADKRVREPVTQAAMTLMMPIVMPIMQAMQAMTDAFTVGFIEFAVFMTMVGYGYVSIVDPNVDIQKEMHRVRAKLEANRSALNIAMSIVVSIVITVAIMIVTAGVGWAYGAYMGTLTTSTAGASAAGAASAGVGTGTGVSTGASAAASTTLKVAASGMDEALLAAASTTVKVAASGTDEALLAAASTTLKVAASGTDEAVAVGTTVAKNAASTTLKVAASGTDEAVAVGTTVAKNAASLSDEAAAALSNGLDDAAVMTHDASVLADVLASNTDDAAAAISKTVVNNVDEAAAAGTRTSFEIGQQSAKLSTAVWTAVKEGAMSWSFIFGQVINAGFSVFSIMGAVQQDQSAADALEDERKSIQALWGFIEDNKVNLVQNQESYLSELRKKHQVAVGNAAFGLKYYTNFLNSSVNNVQTQIAQALAQQQIQLLTPDENGLRAADIGATWGLQTQFNYLYPSQGFITTTLGRPDFPYAQEVAQTPLASEVHGKQETNLQEINFNDDQPAATKLWFNQRTTSVLEQAADKPLTIEIQFRVIYNLTTAYHVGLYLGGKYHDYNSPAYLQSIQEQGSIDLNEAHLAKMFVLKREAKDAAPSLGIYEHEGQGWIAEQPVKPNILNNASIYHMSATLNKDQLIVSFWPEDNLAEKWTQTVKVTPGNQRTFGVIFSGIAIQWGVVQPTVAITQNKQVRSASNGQSEINRETASKAKWKQLLSPKFGSMILQSLGRPALLQGQYLYTTQSTNLTDSQGTPITDYVVFATASGNNITGIGANPAPSDASQAPNSILSLITGNVYNSSGKIITQKQNALNTYAQNSKSLSQSLGDKIAQAAQVYQQQLLNYQFGSYQLTAISQDALNAGLFIYTCPTTLANIYGSTGQPITDTSGKPILDYLIMADLVNNSLGSTVGMPPSNNAQGMVSLITGNVYSKTSSKPVDSGYSILGQYVKQYGKLPENIANAITLATDLYNGAQVTQAPAKTTQVSVVQSQTMSFTDLMNALPPSTGGAQFGLSDAAPSKIIATSSSISKLQANAAGTATVEFASMGLSGMNFGSGTFTSGNTTGNASPMMNITPQQTSNSTATTPIIQPASQQQPTAASTTTSFAAQNFSPAGGFGFADHTTAQSSQSSNINNATSMPNQQIASVTNNTPSVQNNVALQPTAQATPTTIDYSQFQLAGSSGFSF